MVLQYGEIGKHRHVMPLVRGIEADAGNREQPRVFLAAFATVPDLPPPEALFDDAAPHIAVKLLAVLAGTEDGGVQARHPVFAVTADPRERRIDVDDPVVHVTDHDGIVAAFKNTERYLKLPLCAFLAVMSVATTTNPASASPSTPIGVQLS